MSESRTITRSWGVTTIAVLLIVGGALTLYGSVIGQGTEKISPEEFEKYLEQTQTLWASIQKAYSSSRARVALLLYGLAGVGGVAVGIGILLLKSWARALAIWSAWLAVPLGCWRAVIMLSGVQGAVLQSQIKGRPTVGRKRRFDGSQPLCCGLTG